MEAGNQDLVEGPRRFIAGAELDERRPLEASEFAELQVRIRRGQRVMLIAALGVIASCSLCCGGVTYSESSSDLAFKVTLAGMVGLAAVVLYARDGFCAFRHYRTIRPDDEVLLFGTSQEEPPQYTVLARQNLIVREGAAWLETPIVAQITEVAPASKRTPEVAGWLLDQDGETATRMLEPAEREELERHLNNPEHKFRWYEWLYLIWAIVALSSIIVGPAREQGLILTKAIVVIVLSLLLVYRQAVVHRFRRNIRLVLSEGMVEITRWSTLADDELQDEHELLDGDADVDDPEPTVITLEVLLPVRIPWSVDGAPEPWRSL